MIAREDEGEHDRDERQRQGARPATRRTFARRRHGRRVRGRGRSRHAASPREDELADAGLRTRTDLDHAGDAAGVHDRDPVGEVDELVEVGRDDEDGDAAIGELADALADRGDRPDVEAVGRLAEDDDARIERELASEDRLLDVAAAELADRRPLGRGPDVELLDERSRGRVDAGPVHGAPPPEGRLADALEEQVQPDRVGRHDALRRAGRPSRSEGRGVAAPTR